MNRYTIVHELDEEFPEIEGVQGSFTITTRGSSIVIFRDRRLIPCHIKAPKRTRIGDIGVVGRLEDDYNEEEILNGVMFALGCDTLNLYMKISELTKRNSDGITTCYLNIMLRVGGMLELDHCVEDYE